MQIETTVQNHPEDELYKENQPKKGVLRINAKTWFLTFPQVAQTLPFEQIFEKFQDFFKSKNKKILKFIVCLEDHKDKIGQHYHVVFVLDQNFDSKNPKVFDHIFGSHGNYQGCKKFKEAVKYVMKDGNFWYGGEEDWNPKAVILSLQNKTSTESEEVALKIMENRDLDLKVMAESNPGFMLNHLEKVVKFQNWWISKTVPDPILEWNGVATKKILKLEEFFNKELARWLNSNIRQPRKLKQKQLWLCGPTNIGKTWLLEELKKRLRHYQIPYDGKWMCDYNEQNKYDFAYMDEFVGQHTISWLNQWLEGTTMKLNVKGMGTTLKTQNLPTIICSNSHPEQVFHETAKENKALFEAFLGRLEVIEVIHYEDVKPLIHLMFNEPPKKNLELQVTDLVTAQELVELACEETLDLRSPAYEASPTQRIENEEDPLELLIPNQFGTYLQPPSPFYEDCSSEDNYQYWARYGRDRKRRRDN